MNFRIFTHNVRSPSNKKIIYKIISLFQILISLLKSLLIIIYQKPNLAIGFGQLEFAQERYNLIGRAGHWWEEKNSSFCLECNECVPKCPHNLDIPNLLKETHDLLIEKPKRRLWS